MKVISIIFALALLAGCISTTPPTSLHQPMSARPVVPLSTPVVTGTIFQAANSSRPFFEDRRARNIGDTLTINIVENTTADKKSNTTTNRSSDNNFSVSKLAGLPGKSLLGAGLAANSDFKFSGDGATASNNVFNGTITVTVVDVFANGNLLVSGEKLVGINHASEFIRFSGVVNPNTIVSGNTVNSVQVADVRVEYRGNGQIENAQNMGWLSRLFLSVLPF